MSDHFKLENVRIRHQKNPETFQIPSENDLEKLEEGDIVKLIFVIPAMSAHHDFLERMWVEISDKARDEYRGILSNSSIHSSELQPGKIIHFKSENIASIWAE